MWRYLWEELPTAYTEYSVCDQKGYKREARGIAPNGDVCEMRNADYYKQCDEKTVKCMLCPKECIIKEGKRGFCGVRSNSNGRLFSEIYAKIAAACMDPIEKKPLYHFMPGKEIFSIGTKGCNLGCIFCQNWHLMENDVELKEVSFEEIVRTAQKRGSPSIAYTYNEPFVWFEFVKDCAKLAAKSGVANVLVTNGFVSEGPLIEISEYIDAMNVDIKSMSEDFYKDICSGQLGPVLRTCMLAKRRGIHLEITNLLIPGKNDVDGNIEELTEFIAGELGADVPLHFSAYSPARKMTIERTSAETLLRAKSIAEKKLSYVYLGNVQMGRFSDTFCPACNNTLIERRGYAISTKGISDGMCASCGRQADIVFDLRSARGTR